MRPSLAFLLLALALLPGVGEALPSPGGMSGSFTGLSGSDALLVLTAQSAVVVCERVNVCNILPI